MRHSMLAGCAHALLCTWNVCFVEHTALIGTTYSNRHPTSPLLIQLLSFLDAQRSRHTTAVCLEQQPMIDGPAMVLKFMVVQVPERTMAQALQAGQQRERRSAFARPQEGKYGLRAWQQQQQ